ncbi:Uncharacterised protein [Vibrio cholerae]|nr:Uncharacterised protein [Vibrio cholerae]
MAVRPVRNHVVVNSMTKFMPDDIGIQRIVRDAFTK